MQKNYCIGKPVRKIKPSPGGFPMIPLAAKPLLMRLQLVTLLVILAFVQVSARVNGQNISIKLENETLAQAFKKIEQKSGYDFIFVDELKDTKKVSGNFSNASIKAVLDHIFKDQPYTYEIINRTVAIKPKKNIQKADFYQSAPQDRPIEGTVFDEKGKPLPGVTVTIKGTAIKTVTGEDGKFTINAEPNAILVLAYIGYKTREVSVSGGSRMGIGMDVDTRELSEIKIGSTGYQFIPKERATGSFSHVNNELLNRNTSQNILDRIENVTSGVLFDRTSGAPDPLLIRGRGTIYANAAPLIVLNNFPYDGDIYNINPNDIESITVLKDGAAASIWGARAGNGVIVITTKQGKTAKPQVQFNSNINIGQRPDLYYQSTITSSDYIELEKTLFEQGFYNSDLSSPAHLPISPVVELLNAKKNGTITTLEADAKIEALKGNDVRRDVEKYLYQNPLNQQYALNVSGITPSLNYIMSVGYDRNQGPLVGVNSKRISLRSQNTFKVTERLQAGLSLNYVTNSSEQGNNSGINTANYGKSLYPYAELVNSNGDPLPINSNLRNDFIASGPGIGLYDWSYSPVDNISASNITSAIKDYMITGNLSYRIISSLTAEVRYQYENSIQLAKTDNSARSYYTRNLVNSFYQPSDKSFPIPKGSIIDNQTQQLRSHQMRAQLNFDKRIDRHQITAIAGYEVKSLSKNEESSRIMGYDPDRGTINSSVDFNEDYILYHNANSMRITNFQSLSSSTDRFISKYANLSYTYDDRYTFSASAREDAANLFGVATNQKGTPLWSIGGAWRVSNESFYSIAWLTALKLRATLGYNGNISRLTSAYTTARFSNAYYIPSLVSAEVISPPNEKLRWERVRNINIGLDFELKNKIISGSIEYYQKRSTDLMGQAPIDPTLGLSEPFSGTSYFFGNIAGMSGSGFDIELNSKNIDSKFKWYTTFLFSTSKSKVTDYLMPVSTNGSTYLPERYINPVIGRPVFSMYSYRWAGLDANTGMPQGVVSKNPSTDYTRLASMPLDSLKYSGSIQPTAFGALRNTFTYRQFSLSLNVSYKFGSYFRAPSIRYFNLYTTWNGHGDYAKRWKAPGDEKSTNVPVLLPYNNGQAQLAENFYMNSEILVQKSDNIRLEDINLSYLLNLTNSKTIFSQIQMYMYASNIGVIWRANKIGLDPYYVNTPRERTRLTLGINATF